MEGLEDTPDYTLTATADNKTECEQFYVKDNIAIVQDEAMEILHEFSLSNTVEVVDDNRIVCPTELSELQKECIIGYMKTYPIGHIKTLTLYKGNIISEEGTVIDCEGKCWSYQERGKLIEGYQKVDREEFEYEEVKLCWD